MSAFRVPSATYRIQFHLGFRFVDARDLVPYLHELGVTDLYASPRFRARRGSSHGYDVADPLRVNSELGTEKEFEELVQRLKHYRMGLLLDIVPNHMAASSDNPWWLDVLENGPSSPYAHFFDINWHPAIAKASFLQENRLLLPILGDLYGNVLENGELSLKLDETGFFVRYYDTKLPLDPKTYSSILSHCLAGLADAVGSDHPASMELGELLQGVHRLPPRTITASEEIQIRREQTENLKRQIWRLFLTRPEVRTCLEQTLRAFNGSKGVSESFDLLDGILGAQAYRVAFWKLAAEEINYRRFFDISDLVGLRVEDPGVFDARHTQIFELIREGKVSGLRIDHIDGLHDPLAYLQRVQKSIGSEAGRKRNNPEFYVVVEKILAEREEVPAEWPVCGTTGYDFLNTLNGIFIDPKGFEILDDTYRRFTGDTSGFSEAAYQGKRQVLSGLFAGEVNALAHELGKLGARDRYAQDVPFSEYVQVVSEVTACLPVYRTYIRSFEIPDRDRGYIEKALEEAQKRTPEDRAGSAAFAFVRRVLLLDPPYYAGEQKQEWLRFVMHWQQFTGAAMAKGFEDTALYIYHPLSSLNEVGGDPGKGVESVDDFHRAMQYRRENMPYTLNTTTTHDTKWSEDIRARINVLSELSHEWEKRLMRWNKWNRPWKQLLNGEEVPDRNEEVLLYQTLLGAWPFSEEMVPSFLDRLKQYIVKAAREAKVHTSWTNPNSAHEGALLHFTEALFLAPGCDRFRKDILALEKTVAYCGALNSMAQVVLKFAAPGAPDFYQGTELWDFSLVDPDNRRPVDFVLRQRLLEELRRQESSGRARLARDLLSSWKDGRIKLYTTYKTVNLHRVHPNLFLNGEYIPLEATGSKKGHLCAFARRYGRVWGLVAVPRLVARLSAPGRPPLGAKVWRRTALVLPRKAPTHWYNVFTDEVYTVADTEGRRLLPLSKIFRTFPVAMLMEVPKSRRHRL